MLEKYNPIEMPLDLSARAKVASLYENPLKAINLLEKLDKSACGITLSRECVYQTRKKIVEVTGRPIPNKDLEKEVRLYTRPSIPRDISPISEGCRRVGGVKK